VTDLADGLSGTCSSAEEESVLRAWSRALDDTGIRLAILDQYADWKALVHLLRRPEWSVAWQEQDTIMMVRSA